MARWFRRRSSAPTTPGSVIPPHKTQPGAGPAPGGLPTVWDPPQQVVPSFLTPPPEPAACLSGHLTRFAALTDRIVVVDTETTGLFSHDRVIEVAVVTMDLSGAIIDEWDTLISPGRDVGPTWLHGITASMLIDAPSFEDIAAELAARFNGAILCAHNLAFDSRMLAREYDRAGLEIDFGAGFDTLAVTGTRLDMACLDAGIELHDHHHALADARATAALAAAVADRFSLATPAKVLTPISQSGHVRRCCRGELARSVNAPPTFLAQLVARVTHPADDGAAAAYLDDLDRAMSDLHLDTAEAAELVVVARSLGLDDADTARLHRRWVDDLIALAADDGVVDGEEYDQLLRVAHLLGVDAARIHDRTINERSKCAPFTLAPGTRVCFTGVPVDEQGLEIDREVLEEHAEVLGLRVENSFTKSRCELLVAADVATQSGKGNKARAWGIPIVAAADFLAAERPGVAVPSVRIIVGGQQAMSCTSCGVVFTAPRSRALCEDCRKQARTIVPAPPEQQSESIPRHAVPTNALEVLVCRACGSAFSRVRTRGRKPHHCPTCT
jgi:DNA polymerase III subunit epsilon